MNFSPTGKAKGKLDRYFIEVSQQEPPRSTQSVDNTKLATNFNVNLPKIKLPQFHGAFEARIQFEDSYNSSVHNNPSSINNVEKFWYLKSCTN
ncbi:hypothetical protein HUJ05_005215 [Dendroctonus ponderosae]|nr:hypothetical protein HUJ05_005215 [Dendroctonus ponderosae]